MQFLEMVINMTEVSQEFLFISFFKVCFQTLEKKVCIMCLPNASPFEIPTYCSVVAAPNFKRNDPLNGTENRECFQTI